MRSPSLVVGRGGGELKQERGESQKALSNIPACSTRALSHNITTSLDTWMKLSILPLNSLRLYMERGLGFRIFCGLGGREGGLETVDKGKKSMVTLQSDRAMVWGSNKYHISAITEQMRRISVWVYDRDAWRQTVGLDLIDIKIW